MSTKEKHESKEIILKQDPFGIWQFTYTNGKTYRVASNVALYIQSLQSELDEANQAADAFNEESQKFYKKIVQLEKEKTNAVNSYLDQRGLNQKLAKQLQSYKEGIKEIERHLYDYGDQFEKKTVKWIENKLEQLLKDAEA